MNTQHVFIIGCKGIPSQYGGFETFVDRLTEYEERMTKPSNIKYHVACRTDYEDEPYEYHSAECFPVKVLSLGAAAAIAYDIEAFKRVIRICRERKIEHPYVYILASRIGPWIKGFVKQVHQLGGLVYLNPDGFEWKRGKWPAPVKAYWKMSTGQMVRAVDGVICDSEYIRLYVQQNYRDDNVHYIPYGSDIDTGVESKPDVRAKYEKWLSDNNLEEGKYFLTVSRLVPENNFETMIREYMASDSKYPFALITTVNDDMKQKLDASLHYTTDERIQFLPVVYDRELLTAIRHGSCAYFHGHEVGGTNPSLLEGMASGTIILAFDVSFNREVCGENDQQGAYYWTKKQGDLSGLINSVYNSATMSHNLEPNKSTITANAMNRIRTIYNWEKITQSYRDIFGK